MNCLEILKELKLPCIRKIWMEQRGFVNFDSINQLMLNSFPPKLAVFCLGWTESAVMDLAENMPALRVVLPRITHEFLTNCSYISKKHFEEIVKLSAGMKRLLIRHSIVDSESELDFSEVKEWKIEFLGLAYTGRNDRSVWSATPKKLDNILSAISKCGLKDSLKSINLHDCGFQESDLKKKLEEHSLAHLTLVSGDHSSMA